MNINGKTLTKAQENLVEKLVSKYGLNLGQFGTTAIVVNPCTGAGFVVDSVVAGLVYFVQKTYRSYSHFGKMSFNGKPVAIGIYDRVRYLILAVDNTTFANVID